jgi:hypothetical protein
MTSKIFRRACTALASLVAAAVPLAAGVTPASANPIPGPVACQQGYVWRGAVPSDYVCVTPATRNQTAYDNSQAAARRNPNGGPYGANTCLPGYVWRGAVPSDYVCVTPATRTQSWYDNNQAAVRQLTSVTETVQSITFNNGVPVGSSIPTTLTLNSNGTVQFQGRMHDSGGTSYDVATSLTWRAADGHSFAATHQGHVLATWDCGFCPGSSPARDDPWTTPSYNSAVQADWANISRGSPGPVSGSAELDVGSLANDISSFLNDVGQVVILIAS